MIAGVMASGVSVPGVRLPPVQAAFDSAQHCRADAALLPQALTAMPGQIPLSALGPHRGRRGGVDGTLRISLPQRDTALRTEVTQRRRRAVSESVTDGLPIIRRASSFRVQRSLSMLNLRFERPSHRPHMATPNRPRERWPARYRRSPSLSTSAPTGQNLSSTTVSNACPACWKNSPAEPRAAARRAVGGRPGAYTRRLPGIKKRESRLDLG